MKLKNYLAIILLGSTDCIAQAPVITETKSSAVEDSLEAYMTPGSMHEMMATWNGDWIGEMTKWTEPGSEPSISKAECTSSSIMGGRYQESVYKGKFNDMYFEGKSIIGYDNGKKIFISTWVDNMGTGIISMEGTWNEKTKKAAFTGTSFDPVTGQDMKVKKNFKIIDNNTQLIEMFKILNGEEFKTMEIKLKRAKKAQEKENETK